MKKKLVYFSILGMILTSCSNKVPLEGERKDIILSKVQQKEIDRSPVVLDPSNVITSNKITPLWTNSMDFGKSKSLRMIAPAILENNKLFCIDAGGLVYAFDAQTGRLLWKKTTTIKGKDGQIGGALSYSNGKLVVTSSFAEAFAFNETDGQMIWRVKIPACCKGDGITIDGNKVYLLCDNSSLQVLDINNGNILWSHNGMMTDISYMGSAGATVKDNIAYFAYPSGEVLAIEDNGSPLWMAMLTKFSFINASESFSHPRACPVVKGHLVYFTNSNQQITAFDKSNGTVIWKKDFGGLETPLVSGNSVFVLNSSAEVICLNKDTGAEKWVRTLPKTENNGWFSSSEPVIWYGPVQTNEGILMISSEGLLITLSSTDGSIKSKAFLDNSGDGIPSRPVLKGNKIYFITNEGSVQAYQFNAQ